MSWKNFKAAVESGLLLLVASILLTIYSHQARADEPWVYEFEFGYHFRNDRLLEPSCGKVVPIEYVQYYASEPRPGWEVACGNSQPTYTHFLGRRCGRPLPRLTMECGWRHFSSPFDAHEISYDALAIRGRFKWGKR